MIFKYPYTDMYALNLDWIIQAIKEMQETIGPLDHIVNTVNGMTGDVEITKALLTQILGNLVETFNGRTGDVELTAEDVNNTMIDITWTSDPGDTISDLLQEQLDDLYASGKRVLIFVNNLGVADKIYFLQYYNHSAQPQEYSPTAALAGVATFNGQTGNVTATGDDLDTSGTDTRSIAESIEDLEETKVPVTRTVNNKPLSANISLNATDIPSQAITAAPTVEMALDNLDASKVPNVRTVNNKSLLNDITLIDEDIPSQVVSGQTTVEGVLTDLDQRVNDQSQQIDDLGPYNGLDSESTITALSAAQGKALNDKLTTVESFSINRGSAISTGTLDNNQCVKSGNVVNVSGRIYGMSNQIAEGIFFKIPEGYRPKMTFITLSIVWDTNNTPYPVFCTVYPNGDVLISLSSSLQATGVLFSASYAI